jgi:hypothetical protein
MPQRVNAFTWFGPAQPFVDRGAHLARSHRFARARDGVVGGNAEARRRLVEGVEEAPPARELRDGRAREPPVMQLPARVDGFHHRDGGHHAAPSRGLRATDTGGVAREQQAGHGCPAVRIDDGHPAVPQRIPAVLHAGRHREMRLRDHALVQQQCIRANCPAIAVGVAVRDGFDMVGAGGAQLRHAAHHLRAAPHRVQQPDRAAHVGREEEAGQVPQRPHAVLRGRRVEDCVDVRPGSEELACRDPEQRTGARDDRASGRDVAGAVQSRLRGAQHLDTAQRGTRNRERPLERPGGEDHAARAHDERAFAPGYRELELGRHSPHDRMRLVSRAARTELRDQPFALPVLGPEQGAVAIRGLRDAAVRIAAGGIGLVEHDGFEARAGAHARRGKAGGPRAHDGDVALDAFCAHAACAASKRRALKAAVISAGSSPRAIAGPKTSAWFGASVTPLCVAAAKAPGWVLDAS